MQGGYQCMGYWRMGHAHRHLACFESLQLGCLDADAHTNIMHTNGATVRQICCWCAGSQSGLPAPSLVITRCCGSHTSTAQNSCQQDDMPPTSCQMPADTEQDETQRKSAHKAISKRGHHLALTRQITPAASASSCPVSCCNNTATAEVAGGVYA